MLAIDTDNSSPEILKRFVAQHDLQQRMLVNGNGVANEKYYAPRFPTKYWVDRSGTIVARHYGAQTVEDIEAQLKSLLK